MKRITEQESLHSDLEKQSVSDILSGINQEDKKVAKVVDCFILEQVLAADLVW